jgi:phage terminase small subunit
MSDRMMQIPVDELLESLKVGYEEYKRVMEDHPEDKEDVGQVKAFCTTIEQMLAAYGNVTKEEMMGIKRPIIGEVSLRRKKKTQDIDLETPTIFRKNGQ